MDDILGFVILHYNAIKETLDCVQSIKEKIDTSNYFIIIVDNKSPNGTGIVLKERFKDDNRIIVLLNKENLGFACGNNVGCKYAIQKLKCDYVCVLNNDTLLVQNNFFSTIQNEYKKSKFAILGPRIILKDGTDNYIYHKMPDVSFFIEELEIQQRNLWQMKRRLNYFVVSCKLIRNFVYKICGKKPRERYKEYHSIESTNTRKENIILHGCCIVFSKDYFLFYEDAFDPNTFLYKEEELLYLRCKTKNLLIVYNPDLIIKHLEDASTNTISRKRRKKIMFQLENQIQSLKILINVMKENEEN